MYKKIFFIILAICSIVFGIAIWKLNTANTKKAPVATIFMTKEGFNPPELSIKQGQMVEFVNSEVDCPASDATCNFWPAGDPHPTHVLYPEFDSREPLAGGMSWAFTFERVGNWGFHDHFKPENKGIIHVLP